MPSKPHSITVTIVPVPRRFCERQICRADLKFPIKFHWLDVLFAYNYKNKLFLYHFILTLALTKNT